MTPPNPVLPLEGERIYIMPARKTYIRTMRYTRIRETDQGWCLEQSEDKEHWTPCEEALQ